MYLQLLRLLLVMLGAACLVIPVLIISIGAQPVADMFAALFRLHYPVSGLGGPNIDNELRFYAVFFAAFGAVTLMTGLRLQHYLNRVPWIAALFFAGGLARGLSGMSLEGSHPLFMILMVFELALPPALIFLMWQGTRHT